MVPAIVITFMAFVGECFKSMSNARIQKAFYNISYIQIAAILLLPQRIYQETFAIYQVLIILGAILVLTWALRAMKAGTEGADVYTLGYMSEVITEHSRRTDIIGRFGGEEFLIVLRFTALEDAVKHAEQLLRQIESISFKHMGNTFNITASIGVSTATEALLDERQLIHEADEALYVAKKNGRNCVVPY